MSPALLMPIAPAILLEVSAMLSSSVGRDQVSQVSTGTSGGGCEDRYDFGMMSAKRLRNENQHFFSSTNPREKIGNRKMFCLSSDRNTYWSTRRSQGPNPWLNIFRLFAAIASGVHALGHHLMMDLNDDEAINGSLRI